MCQHITQFSEKKRVVAVLTGYVYSGYCGDVATERLGVSFFPSNPPASFCYTATALRRECAKV